MYVIHALYTFSGGLRAVVQTLAAQQLREGLRVGIAYPRYEQQAAEAFCAELGGAVELYPLPMPNIKGKLLFGMPLRKLYRRVQRSTQERVVLHAHSPTSVGLLHATRGMRLVCTLHGSECRTGAIRLVFGCILRRLARQGHTLTAVCAHTAQFTDALAGKPGVTATVYNGTAPRVSTAQEAARPFTVGFFADLYELKGWEQVWDAARLLSARHTPQEVCILAAGRPLTPEIAAQAQSAASPCLSFRGLVPHAADVLMPQCHAVLLPSRSEGLPMSLLERASMGTPLLAAPVGGIPELLEDGVNGLFVQRSGEDIAQKIEWLMAHPARYREMRAAAKSTFAARFTIPAMSAGYRALYDAMR